MYKSNETCVKSVFGNYKTLVKEIKDLITFLKFIYLSTLGLSCSTWDLCRHVQDLVPWPGI